MEKNALLVGTYSFLKDDLQALLEQQGYTIYCIDSNKNIQIEENYKNFIWKQSSFLSLKNIFLNIKSQNKEIDLCVLVIDSLAFLDKINDKDSWHQNQEHFDIFFQSYFLFIQEMLSFFKKQKKGVIKIIFINDSKLFYNPLGYGLYNGLKSFLKSQLNLFTPLENIVVLENQKKFDAKYLNFIKKELESPFKENTWIIFEEEKKSFWSGLSSK